MKRIPKVLVVSGSDSSGGAGMQADINMCRYCGVYPLSAVSCITVQSPLGLSAIEAVSPDVFRMQLESSLIGDTPDAVKVGMLPSEQHLEILINFLRDSNLHNVVVDPVFAPTLGQDNMPRSCWYNSLLVAEILPMITLLTPNIPEFKKLSALPERNIVDSDIGSFLFRYGLKALLLKGGHAHIQELPVVTDKLYIAQDMSDNDYHPHIFNNNKIITNNTHGTGCHLSSLIAANLAKGVDLYEAVRVSEITLNRFLKTNAALQFCPTDSALRGPVAIINP